MGYTHYWRMSRDLTDAEWTAICGDFQKGVDNMPAYSLSSGAYYADKPLRIDNQRGGAPEITGSRIWFNGVGDLAHETFVLNKRGESFAFCKTARKPYDLMVQACLLIARNHAPDAIKVTSDGDPEDWEMAREFVESVCGYDPGSVGE